MQKRIPMSKEQVEKLKENPYIQKATQWVVMFTPAFKHLAYNEYYNGKSMKQIFIDSGFDVEVIGEKRISNFRNLIVQKSNIDSNFEDGRSTNYRKEVRSTEAQMAKQIKELKHRNAYLEQENEFLKKIQLLEKERTGKVGKQK